MTHKIYKIAVVDDEEEAFNILKGYFDEYAKEHDVQFDCTWFSNPIVFLTSYAAHYDILFLDVAMPHMNGIEAAHKIRQVDTDLLIVFVTNMKQYAIRGYEVDADDFILKPISYYDFTMKLDRVRQKIENRRMATKIRINDGGTLRFLPVSDIRYIEVARHQLVYHTVEKDYEVRGTLSAVENFLCRNNFARVNKYCIVNLYFIDGIDGYTLYISNGEKKSDETTISRQRKKEFIQTLNSYLGAGLS